jgi:hypothetical protein
MRVRRCQHLRFCRAVAIGMRIRYRCRLADLRGFALLELAIATALASMLVIWGASRVMHEVEDATTFATGSWFLDIRQAIGGMLATHFDDLANGISPLDGNGRQRYGNPAAPTVAELVGEGLLPAGFGQRSPLGSEANIHVVRSAGCPATSCRLDAVAYLQQPILQRGSIEADFARVGGLVMAMQGHGLAVYASEPGWLRGSSARFTNPLQGATPALPVGTVGVWAGYDRFSFDRYVRMNDVRDPMLAGSLTVAGAFSAQNAKISGPVTMGADVSASRELNVGGGVHAATRVDTAGDIAAGGNLTVARNAVIGGNLATRGELAVSGPAHVASDLTVMGRLTAGAVAASGRVSAAEYLLVHGRAEPGAACSENGLIGRTFSGMLLSCDGGRWGSSNLFGGAFERAINDRQCSRRQLSTPNPVTGDCTCPPRFEAIRMGTTKQVWNVERGLMEDATGFVCVQGVAGVSHHGLDQ